MTTTDERALRYIDSDGHILEPPTAMLDFAPAEFRDRIWHLETGADGIEYSVWNGRRMPSTGLAGTAGFSDEDVDRVRNGELNYSTTRPSGWTASLRLADMETDGIDVSVLYPTTMLGLQSMTDVEFGRVQARGVQRLVRRAPEGGRGALVRGGRAPADPRTRRRARCGRRDPARGRAARDGVGLHAAEPGDRVALLQRRRVRPHLVGTAGHRASRRVPPVPRARPPRRVRRVEARVADTRTTATSHSTSSRRPRRRRAARSCSRTSTSPRRSPTPST